MGRTPFRFKPMVQNKGIFVAFCDTDDKNVISKNRIPLTNGALEDIPSSATFCCFEGFIFLAESRFRFGCSFNLADMIRHSSPTCFFDVCVDYHNIFAFMNNRIEHVAF